MQCRPPCPGGSHRGPSWNNLGRGSSACGIVYRHMGWIAGWDATEVSPWALTSVDKPRTVLEFLPSILLWEVWGSFISYVSIMANWNQGGGGSLWWSLQECRCLLSSSSSPSERPWRRDAHVIVASLPVLSLRVCCSQKEHSRSWRAEGLTDGKGGGGKGEAGLQGKSLFLLTVDPLMTDGLGEGLKPFSYPDFCYACFLPSMRTSLVAQGQRIHLECRRFRLNPWVGKIPWRRA